jgi:hypothetical protein
MRIAAIHVFGAMQCCDQESCQGRFYYSRQNQAAVVACGDSVFPATSSPIFRTQGTLKVGFLSNLQVAGWLFGNHRS